MSAITFSSIRYAGFTFLTVLATARGQEPSLRLKDALARAAERNPALAAHAYAERSAEALVEQAGLRPNPTLELEAENFAGTGVRRGVRSLEATVQATQSLERGGKREKRVAVATQDRETAAREFALRRAEVLAATALAFVETLAAQQRVTLAREPVRLAREILTAADDRVKAGAASSAESARARAALAAARGELARAEAQLGSARAKLAATWGGAASEVPPLAGSMRLPDTTGDERFLLDQIATHPRVAHQQAIVGARRAALDFERAQATPDITVGGGMRFFREGSDAALVAGVSVPLPTRNHNQGNIRAARETLAGAEQSVRAIESELRISVQAAWQDAAAAQASAQALRRDALPPTEEAHTVVLRAYEQGQLPLIDVLDAQRELIALRRQLLEAETEFAAAHARAEAIVDPTLTVTARLLSLP